MAENSLFSQAQKAIRQAAGKVDTDELRKKAAVAADEMGKRAKDAKDAAVKLKDEVNEKITEMDRMLDEAVTQYNDAYTLMSDAGTQLFIERKRSSDTIQFVEDLVNSIASRPKEFDKEFESIEENRKQFNDSAVFAEREVENARKAAGEAGAGLAAGASVAFMGPTAAMWVATTFGTASTGAAIATLSGAAAESAALAWLGGGAIAAGGGGVVAGNAFLALAGPVGWTIAGASLLGSIVIFTKNKMKSQKQKQEDITKAKENTEKVKEMHAQIDELLKTTIHEREALSELYRHSLHFFEKDYKALSSMQKQRLGSLVNHAKTLSALMDKNIDLESD